jgi:hypothetical protein
METDSIRSSGEDTLVDIWIDGKMRSVSIGRDAIAAFLHLGPDRASALTDEDRREFVRTHLDQVLKTARARLRELEPGASVVTIEANPGGGRPGAPAGDRRNGDRRKGDRRKANLGPPPSGERRR